MAYTEDVDYSTQIRVKLHDMAHDLDHEAEGRIGIYEVVLKVTDDSDLVDTLTVTITVMDRNEAPSTPMEASGEGPDAGRKQRTCVRSRDRHKGSSREHGRR